MNGEDVLKIGLLFFVVGAMTSDDQSSEDLQQNVIGLVAGSTVFEMVAQHKTSHMQIVERDAGPDSERDKNSRQQTAAQK